MVSTKLDGAAGAASIELANGMITETAPMIKLN
jgi:hypothetical protein